MRGKEGKNAVESWTLILVFESLNFRRKEGANRLSYTTQGLLPAG